MKQFFILSALLTSALMANAQPKQSAAPNVPGMLTVTKDANGNTVLSTSEGVIATEKKGVNGASTLTSKEGVLKCKSDAKGNTVCTPN